MLKIEVYDCEHEKDLEKEINCFIEEISKQDKEVIDIKYSTSHFPDENQEQVYSFSALVMYDDKITKKYEILEKVDG